MFAELSQSCYDLAGKQWTDNRSSPSDEIKSKIIAKHFPKIIDEAAAGESKFRLISDLFNFFSTPPGQHMLAQVYPLHYIITLILHNHTYIFISVGVCVGQIVVAYKYSMICNE